MKKHLLISWLGLVLFTCNVFAASFPTEPDAKKTPGALCENPDDYRYPEKIPYCERNVPKSLKQFVIKDYEQTYDFSVEKLGRENFKVDHLIPLCAGGSNQEDNLWPQYKAVYENTDPIEGLVCNKMAEGLLLQKEAVALILDVKHYRKPVGEAMAFLNSLQKKN